MRGQDFSFIQNNVKDIAFQNALISHGLDENSQAGKAFAAVKNIFAAEKDVVNSTESRMTMYTSEVNQYLYPDNSFMKFSQNDSAFAASGETKRLNDNVEGPSVTKGRVYSKALTNGAAVSGASVSIRKNTGNDWTIEYFHTDPQVLTRELTAEVPYDARQDLLSAHSEVINRAIANFTIVEWAPGEVGVAETGVNVTTGSTNNSFVFTSSDKTRNTAVVNGSGTVKRFCQDDLKRGKSSLIRQQIAKGNGIASALYFLPTAEQWDDMQDPALFPNFLDYDKSGVKSPLSEGVIGKMYGINILDPRVREDWGANVLYGYTALSGETTDLTKIEDTATSAASQLSAGIIWAENMVLRAEGSAIVFPWLNSPTYKGDVYAVEARYGAKRKRLDGKGVVAICENPFGGTQG